MPASAQDLRGWRSPRQPVLVGEGDTVRGLAFATRTS